MVLTRTLDTVNLRPRKQSPGGAATVFVFVYDFSPSAGGPPSSYPHLIGEYDSAGNPIREYIWLGDMPVAVADVNTPGIPKILHIHVDHSNAGTEVGMVRSVTTGTVWQEAVRVIRLDSEGGNACGNLGRLAKLDVVTAKTTCHELQKRLRQRRVGLFH